MSTMTIAAGVIRGTFAPIAVSVAAKSGTVSAAGANAGNIPAAANGCAVVLTGHSSTSTSGGTTAATLQPAAIYFSASYSSP